MKRLGFFVLILLLGCSFNSGAAQDQTIERGQEFLKRGAYKEALVVFNALLQKNSNDAAAQIGLAQAMIETGDYSNAEKRLKDFTSSPAAPGLLRVLLGEVEYETGRYTEAAQEFDRARKDAKGAALLRANLGRARSLLAQGKEAEAQPILQEFISYYNANNPETGEELTLIADALVLLEKFHEANDLYIDARDADSTFLGAYIGQGELLNEKYNYEEAASLFQDALKINENSVKAQLGIANSTRLTSLDAPSKAVDRALTINPNSVSALAFRAWLDLESDKPEDANKSIDRALAVNQNSIEALAVRASMFYLADRKPDMEATTKRAMATNPRAGEFYATLAHFAVINRRYHDSVEFGKKAVELSPRLWKARTELGIQMLRTLQTAEGRAEIEKAYENDKFNLWAKNTLDFLDSIADYPETVRGPFLIKCSPEESGVLSVYAGELLEEAHKKLAEKYKFTPRSPIAVELYPNHEDFAVRSLGLPGLGALGICFGQLVAMDSPSARSPGEFNWGSTLWHEYAHVVTIQITDYRIPRWLSEGLSVYEERRARPGWGDKFSITTLKAIADGRFVKIDDLDSAFLRPRAPDQVPLAYFQASLVCDFIDEKLGFDAILKMLAMYKAGSKTPEVFKQSLAMTTADFDKAFNDWLRAKTTGWIEALGQGPAAMAGGQPPSKEALEAIIKARPNDYFAHLRLGSLYKAESNQDKAIEHLKRATELFPYYGGAGNPYAQLGEIYEARGQKAEAAAAMETLTQFTETDVEIFKKLARLKTELGDKKGAIGALVTSFYIYPFDASLHKLAGDIYLEQGSSTEATREFRAVLALNPPDLAEAHFDLARSLTAAGNRAEAKREVLRALEAAPGFEKAQELLLKLRGGS